MSKIKFYIERIKAGRLKSMWAQIKWIYGYAKHYFWHMLFYTVLGMAGVGVSLLLGLVSRDIVDIITGHKTGEILKYFVMMIVYNVVSLAFTQITNYISSYISMKVDAEIKADIFSRTLKYFLAVAEEGNISNAAKLLHVSQPTLSRQLASLEMEFGREQHLGGSTQFPSECCDLYSPVYFRVCDDHLL